MNRKPAHSARRAFTLVELLVVTLLAASFMFGAASVMASIARSRHTLKERQSAAAAPLSYLDLLRWDLINARGMKLVGTRLVLVGYGAIDPETGQPTQQAAEITYDTRDDRRRRWLIRQQRLINAKTNRGITIQPVLGDVQKTEWVIPARWKEQYEKSKLREKPKSAEKKLESGGSSLFQKKDEIEPARANPAIMADQALIPLDPLVADPGWAEIPPQVIVRIQRPGAGAADSVVEQFTLYPRIEPPQ